MKVGDRVRHKKYGDGTVFYEDKGKAPHAAVCFDKKNEELHDLGLYGAPRVKDGHGLWCKEEELTLINR